MANDNKCCIAVAIDSYSSESKFIEMVEKFFSVFGITDKTVDDIFYHGVFCKDITYAGFEGWNDAISDGIEVPEELHGGCNSESGRVEYVNQVIYEIMVNGLEKPEWMTYVEENYTCHGLPPSTFLMLLPTEDYYGELAQSIINFLYSTTFSANTYSCEDEEGNKKKCI